MHRLPVRSGLFLTAAIIATVATPAFAEADGAAAEQPEREYLPPDLIVTGYRDTYVTTDGSTATKTPTPLIDVPQSGIDNGGTVTGGALTTQGLY